VWKKNIPLGPVLIGWAKNNALLEKILLPLPKPAFPFNPIRGPPMKKFKTPGFSGKF